MSRTPESETLSERHRLAQQAISASAIRDFIKVWPVWQGDEESFQKLIAVTTPLIVAYHKTSASTASGYYEALRMVDGIGGAPTRRLADVLPDSEIGGTLYVTGKEMTRKAILAGQSPEAAKQTALVRTSGSVSRLSLQGGRETLIRSSVADKQAGGWYRVTSGSPCAFCALLASRGAVYSEDTADFKAHDHCSCSASPAWKGSGLPSRNREFKDLYNRATREARQAGELRRGTDNDLLNAFRRYLSQNGSK